MAHRHAFRADDFLTCSMCDNIRIIDGLPYCQGDRIRYNPCRFGCAAFGANNMPSDAPEGWTLTAEQAASLRAFISDPNPGRRLLIVHGAETLTICPASWLHDDAHMAAIWTMPCGTEDVSQVIDVSTIRYNQLTNSFDFIGSIGFSLRLPEECRQEEQRAPVRTKQTTLEGFA